MGGSCSRFACGGGKRRRSALYEKIKKAYFQEHEDGCFVIESIGDEQTDIGAHSFALILIKEMADQEAFEKLLSYAEQNLPDELMANMYFNAKSNVGLRRVIDAPWPGACGGRAGGSAVV